MEIGERVGKEFRTLIAWSRVINDKLYHFEHDVKQMPGINTTYVSITVFVVKNGNAAMIHNLHFTNGVMQ